MKRLKLFVKGNVDVHDALHSSRLGGKLVWNGINEVLRTSHPGCLAHVKHETWTRSDALLASDGKVPASARQSIPFGAYPLEMQFSRALFETKADALILTIIPDVMVRLFRHRREGYLLYMSDTDLWSPEQIAWAKVELEPLGRLSAEQSMENLEVIVGKIREQSDAPILIFNMSPIVPGEMLHCYQDIGETYATRIRRFNLGLVELSAKTGISLVDVDSLLARKGTEALKLDVMHLTPEGNRFVAEEVVRVLDDLGVLAEAS